MHELRTYTIHVGKMAAAIKVCRDIGWLAI
jgi:hypothetical protein